MPLATHDSLNEVYFGPSLSTFMCLHWKCLAGLSSRILLTSLHPLSPMVCQCWLTMLCLPALLPSHLRLLPPIAVNLSSNISLLFLFARFTSLEAQMPKTCKNTFSKHAGRFSKHALAVQAPLVCWAKQHPHFSPHLGQQVPKHAFALFQNMHFLEGGQILR